MPIASLNHLRAIASLFDVVAANVAALKDLDRDNPERCACLEAADALTRRTSERLRLQIERINRELNAQ